jgi:serine/threonine-protein kinase
MTSSRLAFDDLLDVPVDRRERTIAELRLPEETRARLRILLAFNDAVALAPAARAAYIASLDIPADQRRQLQAMVATDEEMANFRQRIASRSSFAVVGSDDISLEESLIGTCVGTFLLTELIGRGGSSIVFRAEREAGGGVQTVALKLLRNGLYCADSQRVFRREQAILAQLAHRNIAAFIEGGVTPLGVPYIAMELVEGLPITVAANARKLGIEQRLELFCRLCRAIEAAHSARIVHRDLKPSNLFVTHDGELKVLDFGIAKLLDGDQTQAITQTITLTPEYAAPEQFAKVPLTIAVDIFTLGMVLGELLTGERLSSGLRASKVVAARAGDCAVPDGLPQRNRLVRRLHGDLDAIVAKALALDPVLRYRSADAFADDVERFLSGKSTHARPRGGWYRARRFFLRHRGGVVAMAAFVIMVLAALGIALPVQRRTPTIEKPPWRKHTRR